MRIAVCDNESIAADALLQKIYDVTKLNNIKKFTSIQKFWNVIEDDKNFHVVFMDIDWEQSLDGTDFAARLYKLCPNTQIIYVTGYNDRFAQQIFLKPTKLEHIKSRLPDCFLQCHKSYLVNMDYIQYIEKNGILMNNGERVPVSKARYADTRSSFFRYMGKML